MATPSSSSESSAPAGRRRARRTTTLSGDMADDFDRMAARSGIRTTQQRRLVYEALMERHDHPTAQDLFLHVKAKVPSISLATVYNCLETLTNSGLIRHVNLDRAPSRYCQNPDPHGHFFCDSCGAVSDVPLRGKLDTMWELPAGTVVTHAEVNLRGYCADCAKSASFENTPLS